LNMKPFLDQNFLLETDPAQKLYHEFAADMPIFDYHCHLPPDQIAQDRTFKNLTEAWLAGDHFKWRAMRSNGVPEKFCTGTASAEEKFQKWAETVPETLGNPLYHWTHLELKSYFGISGVLLNGETAGDIFKTCSEKLQSPEFSVRNLMKKMKVRAVCTTDDPVDSLEYHTAIANDGFEIKVLPTFRPDKSLGVDLPEDFNQWVSKLESVTDMNISAYSDFLTAIQKRHDFFHQVGGRLSDRGVEQPYSEDFTVEEVGAIFERVRLGKTPNPLEILKFRSAMLYELAKMDHAAGWTMQMHLGALRNNNKRLLTALGPDTGFDSIGDFEMGRPLSRFLDRLDATDQLPKTILYNLNPCDNELVATMAGNFQDGPVAGKIQFGSGWWFLDQKDGMEKQLVALGNLGLLSRFVGMLTDSRSFLSYPRHEYFRRILCNLLGGGMNRGELPGDFKLVGEIVKNICFRNAQNFFGITVSD